jgi:hypothetical protein
MLITFWKFPGCVGTERTDRWFYEQMMKEVSPEYGLTRSTSSLISSFPLQTIPLTFI